jgi:hypothetical protein
VRYSFGVYVIKVKGEAMTRRTLNFRMVLLTAAVAGVIQPMDAQEAFPPIRVATYY